MTRILLGFLFALVVAMPASAETWDDCFGNTSGDLINVYQYGLLCAALTNADSTNNTRQFTVRAREALLCFNPNVAGTSTTGNVSVRHCPDGNMPTSNPEYGCINLAADLTGVGGASANSCQSLTPGVYYVDITTAMGAGITGQVTIQGGGN